MEESAAAVYRRIAGTFAYNGRLNRFMVKMAEDELFHLKVMKKAHEFVIQNEIQNEDIIIDENTRNYFEEPLRQLVEFDAQHHKNEEELYDLLIKVEFSEWNDIFIYIIRTLAEKSKEFESMSSIIQNHEQRIKDYFGSIESGESWLERIDGLPKLWDHAILIIDDNQPYRELLMDILSDDYRVAGAVNGAAALKELKEHHYDILISDVDMPEMNGLELFDVLQADDPQIREKFFFMTGDPTHEDEFTALQRF